MATADLLGLWNTLYSIDTTDKNGDKEGGKPLSVPEIQRKSSVDPRIL